MSHMFDSPNIYAKITEKLSGVTPIHKTEDSLIYPLFEFPDTIVEWNKNTNTITCHVYDNFHSVSMMPDFYDKNVDKLSNVITSAIISIFTGHNKAYSKATYIINSTNEIKFTGDLQALLIGTQLFTPIQLDFNTINEDKAKVIVQEPNMCLFLALLDYDIISNNVVLNGSEMTVTVDERSFLLSDCVASDKFMFIPVKMCITIPMFGINEEKAIHFSRIYYYAGVFKTPFGCICQSCSLLLFNLGGIGTLQFTGDFGDKESFDNTESNFSGYYKRMIDTLKNMRELFPHANY